MLLIACFNFVNLAPAKSLHRAKEVGIRKTGASQQQLMLQFLIETVLLRFVSVLVAAVLTSVLPTLDAFTGKDMSFNLLAQPIISLLLVVLTVVVGLMAGFYPALVLSGFQPIKVLKRSVASEGMFGRVQ